MGKVGIIGRPYPTFSVKEELDLLHQEQLEDQEYMRDLFADYDESDYLDDSDDEELMAELQADLRKEEELEDQTPFPDQVAERNRNED